MTVVASNVHRVFRIGDVETHALRGIDLTIGDGEFVCLSGWSGSGKTTLLNLLGSLDDPTDGTITIDGVDPVQMSDAARAQFRLHNVGFVFQAYNLVPVLSGYENAEMLLVLQGVPAAERRKRVEPLLEVLGVSAIANKRPLQMSGGQQQRFAVARAIASHPKIILADEPTANLDSTTSTDLMDHLAMLNREKGLTFVFSSHDSLIQERAGRLIELRDGRVLADEVRNT